MKFVESALFQKYSLVSMVTMRNMDIDWPICIIWSGWFVKYVTKSCSLCIFAVSCIFISFYFCIYLVHIFTIVQKNRIVESNQHLNIYNSLLLPVFHICWIGENRDVHITLPSERGGVHLLLLYPSLKCPANFGKRKAR